MKFTKCLFVGILMFTNEVRAIPLIDEGGVLITLPTAINGRENLTAYQDNIDPHLFWWSPYRVEIAKNPGTTNPRITWRSKGDQPTLMVVSKLTGLGAGFEAIAKSQISKETGISLNDVKLFTIPVQNAEITVEAYGLSTLSTGEWKPLSSLVFGFIPETLRLSTEINQFWLDQVALKGSPEIKVKYNIQFLAAKTGAFFSREFNWDCAFEQFGIHQGQVPDSITGRTLLNAVVEVDSSCVSARHDRGEISADSIVQGWTDYFIAQGLLTPSLDNDGNYSVGNMLNLLQTSGEMSYDIPAEIGTYPLEISAAVTTLPKP